MGLVDLFLWFFAFKNSDGSFLSFIGLRILYGLLIVVAVYMLFALMTLLFGHFGRTRHT